MANEGLNSQSNNNLSISLFLFLIAFQNRLLFFRVGSWKSKRRFNTAIIVDKSGKSISKYRKIHLPGHQEHEPWRLFQHLEKRYFEVGEDGFSVAQVFEGRFGMCICNDRRWPETYRVLGLQGAEVILLGYNCHEIKENIFNFSLHRQPQHYQLISEIKTKG